MAGWRAWSTSPSRTSPQKRSGVSSGAGFARRDIPGSPPGTHDFDVALPGGRIVALEITTAAHEPWVQLTRRVSAQSGDVVPVLRHTWSIRGHLGYLPLRPAGAPDVRAVRHQPASICVPSKTPASTGSTNSLRRSQRQNSLLRSQSPPARDHRGKLPPRRTPASEADPPQSVRLQWPGKSGRDRPRCRGRGRPQLRKAPTRHGRRAPSVHLGRPLDRCCRDQRRRRSAP